MVRWVVGLILHALNPLSYFSFQPVLHDWCNKGRGWIDRTIHRTMSERSYHRASFRSLPLSISKMLASMPYLLFEFLQIAQQFRQLEGLCVSRVYDVQCTVQYFITHLWAVQWVIMPCGKLSPAELKKGRNAMFYLMTHS